MTNQFLYNGMDENDLFLKVAEGDETAFTIIYQHFMTLLAGAMMRLLQSEKDVEEALQEAFLRIWLNRDSIPDITNPGGWVRKIVINECYRLLRKRKLRDRLQEDLFSLADDDSYDNAIQQVAFNETKRIIQDAVAEMSPRQATIYNLSRIQGKTTREIAATLHLSNDYVKKTLATALEKVRKKLIAAGKLLPSILL
ncbi:sigma-70 family RNA polymerase sigma factor [Chitinophaga sancti]|uniref:RNA polymerase sigma factor n=1 Tax=Chitinophaga sancti TaxID=1004 RepID=UPI002A757AB3|nr:sigma-70 family RNA polymerase sigma factor [Chitinophaga sancti]WPQ66206.1 sigma-70 family RNA polymerase sigma factor [Chitinophaga sancti]